MAKQTPYRYSADAKEIIRNTHDFCNREKENGLKPGVSLNQVKKEQQQESAKDSHIFKQRITGICNIYV